MAHTENAGNARESEDSSQKGGLLTFLRARRPINKILRPEDGRWVKDPAPKNTLWTVKPEAVRNLEELFHSFQRAAHDGRTIFIHGGLKPGVSPVNVRRKGDRFDDLARPFVILDVDDVAGLPLDPCEAATVVRELLPIGFHEAECIWNATAGHAIPDDKTGEIKARLRLIFWTDRPVTLAETDAWLGACGVKLDRSIWRLVQPLYLGVTVDGIDPVARRWGMLPGDAAVAVPADLHATTKATVDRLMVLPANVVPNDPAEIRKFVDILETRREDRIERDGRRMSWFGAANDGFDRVLSEDLILSCLVT